MINYATEFPIEDKFTIEDVLDLARAWILGSPHTNFKSDEFSEFNTEKEFSISIENEEIASGKISTQDYDIAGVKYTKIEDDSLAWVTTLVTLKTSSQHIVNVQVACEALGALPSLPPPKKPYIVKQIVEKMGGALDGEIPVSDKPIKLSTGDEHIAADLILGRARNSLPIVYVSSGFDGALQIDPSKMARWLSGMAHVVVEPDRRFSLNLKQLSDSRNVFGGTIGVYWPNSDHKKSYYVNTENNAEQLKTQLMRDIRSALANRRQKASCTWLHLKELLAKDKYESVKKQESASLDEILKACDDELQAKQSRIDEAEAEIARLRIEVNRLENGKAEHSSGLLNPGTEQDLYRGEIREILLKSLIDAQEKYLPENRKSHVISDIISHNKSTNEGDRIKSEIKSLLKNYKTMNQATKRALNQLGLYISDEGKHYKIIYQGDGRYTFSLSKTSSDFRAGNNFASDICKIIF
ncbi:hypothetical protein [Chitiniphilus shinanonensis]|uniref:hypothetical protein n=1 Tax=Chitiniphilus shinanonensis TaxID=553088 RepID=UPI0030635957